MYTDHKLNELDLLHPDGDGGGGVKDCAQGSPFYYWPRLLPSSESMAANIAREARVPHPQLAGERRGTDDLLLAALELVDVPGGKYNLAIEELGLGRRDPDQEVRGERD